MSNENHPASQDTCKHVFRDTQTCAHCGISFHALQEDTIGKLIARIALFKKCLALVESDPHQFSKRPCTTCQTISELAGYKFGCSKTTDL